MLDILQRNEFLAGLLLSWTVWVTVSIFNQRQEIALLKQILRAIVRNNEKVPNVPTTME